MQKTYRKLEKKQRIISRQQYFIQMVTRDSITLDKIPYVGEYSNLLPNMYIATGFNKWGMTSSNIATNIIVDKIEEKGNTYEEVFKSTRLKPITIKEEMKNVIIESIRGLLQIS